MKWRWSPAIWLIVLLPVLMQLPVLLGRYDADPMLFVGSVGDSAQLRQGYPWIDPNVGFQAQALGKLSADQFLEGRVPWWNPYNGVGLPLAAEAQPASLFLPFVLLYHFRDGIIWVELLLQIIAGLCTYALLRRMKLTELAATTGGLLYEFNGTFAWHGAPIIGPIAFLPMLLLGTEQLFGRVSEGRTGGWLLIPLALAWSIYAGFPETAYLNGLFVGLWVLFRLPDLPSRARWSYLGKLSLSVCVGLALSLPQIIPFLEFVSNAYVGGHEGYFVHYSLPGAATALTLMPGLFGPIFQFNDPANVIRTIWGDIGGYQTALQLAVMVLALLVAPRRLIWAPLLWIALCLGKTFDIRPISDLVNLIPMVTSAAFHRYAPPSWEFAGVVLICLGIDAMQRGAVPRDRQVLVAFAVTCGCVLGAWWLAHAPIQSLWSEHASAHAIGVALAWLAWSLTGGLVVMLMGRDGWGLRWLVLLLVADALFMFALPLQSGASVASHQHPGVAYLQDHVGLQRTYSLGPLAPNYGAYFRVPQINHNYLPVSSDWLAYVQSRLDPASNEVTFLGGDNRTAGHGAAADQLKERRAAYEEVGVRYVIARPGVDPFSASLTLPTDPMIHHGPLVLERSQMAVLRWDVPVGQDERLISAVSVPLGNYAGLSDGELGVRVCTTGDACANGRRPLVESIDNQPFSISLDQALPLPGVSREGVAQLIITITHIGGAHPVALWVDGVPADHADSVSLEGSPKGVAPGVSLAYGERAAANHPRRVYDGADMAIYELPGARPYFDIIDGQCEIHPVDREHVQARCATPSVLLRREAFYPGWVAIVDGQVTTLRRTRELFQTLAISPGVHDIGFRYRPSYYTLILAGLACGVLVLLAGVTLEFIRRGKRNGA